MELFCSLYDLTDTNLNFFIDLTKGCGIHVQYAKGLYIFLSLHYCLLLLEKNIFQDLRKIIDKFIEMERFNCEKVLNNTSFFKSKYSSIYCTILFINVSFFIIFFFCILKYYFLIISLLIIIIYCAY